MNLLETIKQIPTRITIHHPNKPQHEHTWCPLCSLDYVRHEHRAAGEDCPWCRGDAERAAEGILQIKTLLAVADGLSDSDLDLLVRHAAGGWQRAKFREILEKRTAKEPAI